MLIKNFLMVAIFSPIFLVSMEDQPKFGSNSDNTSNKLFSLWLAMDTTKDEREKKKNDQLELIKTRLEKSLNLNEPVPDSFGKSPLHIVVADFYDKGMLADQLLQAGADPDVCGASGRTPLHVACNELSIANIKVLLKYNANPNAQDEKLETPLHKICAQYHHHPAQIIAAKILLSYGAIFQENYYGYTPLKCITSNLELRQLIERIYDHKKSAYLFLLMGKGKSQLPFKHLPMDCVRSIIDKLYPHYPWPKQSLNCADPLSFLKQSSENKK